MLNLFDMLSAPVKPLMEKKEAPKRAVPIPTNKPWLSRRDKADAKFRALLKDGPKSTGEISGAFSYTHMGCLTSLYRMEKRGLVKRVGSRPRDGGIGGRGQILWAWAGE